MRERSIESYLHREVEKHGGTTRKFKSPGRVNVPDRIVIWPPKSQDWRGQPVLAAKPDINFVECKAPGKKARPGQVREHARLRKLGCIVLVLDTKEKIDDYIARNK